MGLADGRFSVLIPSKCKRWEIGADRKASEKDLKRGNGAKYLANISKKRPQRWDGWRTVDQDTINDARGFPPGAGWG